jgi:hypothetical protein
MQADFSTEIPCWLSCQSFIRTDRPFANDDVSYKNERKFLLVKMQVSKEYGYTSTRP